MGVLLAVQLMKGEGFYFINSAGEKFIVRGVCYNPVPVGRTPYDYNLFDDPERPWLMDGELMQTINVNAVRVYGVHENLEKMAAFIRQMRNFFGIYTLVTLPFPVAYINFPDSTVRKDIEKRILRIVDVLKEEDGVLAWLLGNEVDVFFYDEKAGWTTDRIEKLASPYKRAVERAKLVFKTMNKVIKKIHKVDSRPVGVSLSGQTYFVKYLAKFCPEADFIGTNYYGGTTFGVWWSVARKVGKPVLVTEFGVDSFNTKLQKEDQRTQADMLVKLWKDIEKNSFLYSENPVALGGFIFSWSDEWWKYEFGSPDVHDTQGSWANPSWPDYTPRNPKNVQEEWWGIVALEPVDSGLDRRVPREIYKRLEELWMDLSP